jgi:hypothetical protein
LASGTTTEWIRPESLSTPAWTYRFLGLRLPAEIALAALFGLLHLWIQLACPVVVLLAHLGFALVEMELCAGIKVASHDRALSHRHAFPAEMGFGDNNNLPTEAVFPKQVAEREDRGLIGDPIDDHRDAGKVTHGGHIDLGLFDRWIDENIPLLRLRGKPGLIQRLRKHRAGDAAAPLPAAP